MRDVWVIGAGVVGVTTAWYLAEAGWRVTLLDRTGAVGQGTSQRNGGQLSYRYVSPLADAGVPLKAVQWLLQPDGPLRFRPQAELAQWRWVARFLRRCHGRANLEMTRRLARLGEYSRNCLAMLMRDNDLPPFDWQESGKLVVYRTRATFERAARSADNQGRRVLDASECLAAEPALATLAEQLQGGLLTADEAVADCHAFCCGLFERLQQHPRYAGLVAARALRFEQDAAGTLALVSDHGRHGADAFVLAAGIGSRALARSAGLDLPLYPLKGYSLDMPIGPQHVPPRASITDFERKVLYARIGHRLRVAAMVDLVGEDDSIDPHRIGGLRRVAQRDLPHAGDYERAEPWAGLRPATPDGAPIVGPTALPGLWLNLGHGALGFTFACGTASLLAHLMGHGEAPLPLDGITWPLQ